MGIIIGIDIGGSTTKIIGFSNRKGRIIQPMQVKANDPVTSVYGAFGRFLSEGKIALGDIERVTMTGVGSSYIKDQLYGLPTGKVSEFEALGAGGLYMTGLDKAIIVSMGTGTSFVRADGTDVVDFVKSVHIGGTGVGGGTLLGLSKLMLNVQNFDTIMELATLGDLHNIDLHVKDITKDVLEGLPPDVTAANFGNISDNVTKNDIALGIINMVLQSIGMMSIFVAKIYKEKNIILAGNLTGIQQANHLFGVLESLHGVSFHIPENAEYIASAGSAIAVLKGIGYTEI